MLLRFIKLWVAASVLFGLADFIFSWNPLAAAPYLAHRTEPIFRAVPFLKFGIIVEDINGFISSIAYLSIGRTIEGAPIRRGCVFGLMIWGLWVVSGTMSAFVWLNVPVSLALANVLFGLPKCIAIGSGIAWTWSRLQPAAA